MQNYIIQCLLFVGGGDRQYLIPVHIIIYQEDTGQADEELNQKEAETEEGSIFRVLYFFCFSVKSWWIFNIDQTSDN